MGTLEIRSLSRIRGGVLIFDDVSFTVPDGHVAAIVGPAMAGKTSLLRVIAGVERPDSGDVVVDDQSILRLSPERRRFGFLFDDLALFEQMTVRENVAFGLRMHRYRRMDRLRRTDEVLSALGLLGLADRAPRDLSPGERKRVAFARAVAPEPSLLLLDEPTAGIEQVERETWRHELVEALRALRVTTLIATADMLDAVTMADDLVLMSDGQVLQTGTAAHVLQEPVSIEAATLAGYVTLVRGDVAARLVVEPGAGAIAFPAGLPLRQHAAIMAHPTALFGVPHGSGLGSGVSGTLTRARPDGPAYLLEVQVNSRPITLRWEWDVTPPALGTRIEIAVRPGTLRFFNDTPASRVRVEEVPSAGMERTAPLTPVPGSALPPASRSDSREAAPTSASPESPPRTRPLRPMSPPPPAGAGRPRPGGGTSAAPSQPGGANPHRGMPLD